MGNSQPQLIDVDRRSFLDLAWRGTTAFAFLGAARQLGRLAGDDKTARRNIVLVLSDDHRYDFMRFMPQAPAFLETPNMDRMAQQGAHLVNAFVSTSLCSPSRASILTGQYMHHHHIVDNQRPEPRGDNVLSAIPATGRLPDGLHRQVAHGRGAGWPPARFRSLGQLQRPGRLLRSRSQHQRPAAAVAGIHDGHSDRPRPGNGSRPAGTRAGPSSCTSLTRPSIIHLSPPGVTRAGTPRARSGGPRPWPTRRTTTRRSPVGSASGATASTAWITWRPGRMTTIRSPPSIISTTNIARPCTGWTKTSAAC